MGAEGRKLCDCTIIRNFTSDLFSPSVFHEQHLSLFGRKKLEYKDEFQLVFDSLALDIISV